jgi:large subunit ribosomal protein L5
MSYVPRLRAKYKGEVAPALQKEFGYTSFMQVPRLTKISLNQGLGCRWRQEDRGERDHRR